jgi:hypothetical protein
MKVKMKWIIITLALIMTSTLFVVGAEREKNIFSEKSNNEVQVITSNSINLDSVSLNENAPYRQEYDNDSKSFLIYKNDTLIQRYDTPSKVIYMYENGEVVRSIDLFELNPYPLNAEDRSRPDNPMSYFAEPYYQKFFNTDISTGTRIAIAIDYDFDMFTGEGIITHRIVLMEVFYEDQIQRKIKNYVSPDGKDLLRTQIFEGKSSFQSLSLSGAKKFLFEKDYVLAITNVNNGNIKAVKEFYDGIDDYAEVSYPEFDKQGVEF